MPAPRRTSGGIPLFRVFGIDVSLHWMWILVAVYGVEVRRSSYTSLIWCVFEYISLFVIVLLHEFGHSLACKSVGGEANRIMLWPLGGVAYVNPPPRPGAMLWSIAAGPLVNLLLLPVFIASYVVAHRMNVTSDLRHFTSALLVIDIVLFVFNMLPIYPLDGGQIVRSLLWFVIGRSKSLMVASVIGIIGGAGIMLWAISTQDMWLIILAVFGLFRSITGIQEARMLARFAKLPRHQTVACPHCGEAPPMAPLWRCRCGAKFDTFQTRATCPQCRTQFATTMCLHCGRKAPIDWWPGMENLPLPLPAIAPLAPAPPLAVSPIQPAPPWP